MRTAGAKTPAAPIRRQVQLCIGKAGTLVGSLEYVRQGQRDEDRSYTEIADAIPAHGHAPKQDVQQLWRRLAPAFDINPFPDKARESKTWLSEQDGPITDVPMLLARAAYFALNREQALATLAEVHAAVSHWRELALSPEVGLLPMELGDFAPAFEHEQMKVAAALL